MRLGFARLSNEDIKKGIKIIGQSEKEIRKQVWVGLYYLKLESKMLIFC